ncbi:MAG: hypothetical protein NTX33_15495 [Propionibacteriales bacterium]|nr:hypothetical protein [Propionibacteriales bacterium]
MSRLLSVCMLGWALCFPTACADDGPDQVARQPGTAAVATRLAADLEQRYTDEGAYPLDSIELGRLLDDELTPLPPDVRVHTYFRLTRTTGFLLCVVNAVEGTFAFIDSTKEGIFDQGTIEPGADSASFDVECSPTLTD